MFFELFGVYLEGGAVGSTKVCARVCHYKMQRMTKVIQKLDPVCILQGSCGFSTVYKHSLIQQNAA